MKSVNLLLTNNISNNNVYENLNKNLKNKETLFLCATQNLKRLRIKNEFASQQNIKLSTFSEIKEEIYDCVRKGPAFLSRADQRFLLNQVIKALFKGERQRALYKIRNDLFELYEFLIEEEVGNLSDETIEKIAIDFTDIEKDVFVIYNAYYNALYDIKRGLIPEGIDIERINTGRQIKLLSESYNTELFKQIDNYQTIVFDGFLFFNEEQKKLLTEAIYKNKDIFFIAKTMKADKDNFLVNYLFKPLAKEMNIDLNIIQLPNEGRENSNAITFVKNNYLDFTKTTNLTINDGFNFVEPFPSRDREMNYIIVCIARYLQEKCGNDKRKICKMLAEDIAVIIANDKEKYEHQLNVILKDVGVFFLNEKSELLNTIDRSNLKEVIYKRSEFVEARIKKVNGDILTHQEKLVAFTKLYKGINISQKARSFINYPIGQYILEIYRIVKEGMSCEGFKKILYSNWYYNVGLDTIKYDKFIKEFNYIEPYIRKKTNPDDWVKELNIIKQQKQKIENKKEYAYHPLNCISYESLEFLLTQIDDTRRMVNNLSKVFGDINEHLKALNDNFLLDDILDNPNITNEFEMEVISHLKDIIDSINKSNLVTNIDSKYFSDNIKNMLADYEREKAESSADELTLNVVNLENMQKFKLTFFCMMEEDKYPRQYKMNFPFNENILEILENPKYEIEHRPSFIKTLDYHLLLEKYLFLNTLDFTEERMIITQTEEENGKSLSNSIYVEDIFSMFKEDIKYIRLRDRGIRSEQDYHPKTNVSMSYNDDMPIKLIELCSFFLCPKIYYYLTNINLKNEISYDNEWKLNIFIPSLIFYKTLYKLGLDGEQNKTIFSLNNSNMINKLDLYLEQSLEEELMYFDFINHYERKDIKKRVETTLNSFIKRNLIDKDLLFVQFGLSTSETIPIINDLGKKFDIVIDSCLLIKNAQTGRYINYDISSQMDLLVKSAGGDYSSYQHFQDIFNRLAEKKPYDDRVALVNYLFWKINIQLNSPYYRKDGLKRIKELSIYIRKQTDKSYIPSSYCRYCKFEKICKMKERGAI